MGVVGAKSEGRATSYLLVVFRLPGSCYYGAITVSRCYTIALFTRCLVAVMMALSSSQSGRYDSFV